MQNHSYTVLYVQQTPKGNLLAPLSDQKNLLSQASNKAELTPAPLPKEFEHCSLTLRFETCGPHRR